ncbi:tRNA pseudouridine(55) synthase TruB [Acholeplasma equirhinis]|uniref:tRNA pseudouridine(55) synthase TruB n=1 Tax=Acholeplasma equirhinis TaxID=555393 RepID=UPI00197A9272|nr:tRNA pseudouridine(55) synthase TruB [Acholeplasma equirhinis]MBN3490478.1 tRNA pseudouridine(55) synthase TruB [Acholeplasma equirhinis]
MDGILLIHKEAGLTSHDVVYRVKRKLKLDKVGHTGTLDPFATGLLILLIGKATKLAFLFDDLSKTYEGSIVFGKAYDTDDVTGEVLETSNVIPSLNQIESEIKNFLPRYEQIPPQYSAIKKNGRKAYDIARSGEKVEFDTRKVEIYSFDIINYGEALEFKTHVSKGTYIRSIARDLGLKLNTFGALSRLKRMMIGAYDLSQAKTIDEVELTDLIPDTKLFESERYIVLNDFVVKLVKNGQYLDSRHIKGDEPVVILDQNKTPIAFYVKENEVFVPKYFFRGSEL